MSTVNNTYLNLCTQVYDLSKPEPPVDAYAFYRSYILSAQGKILEPMCGTGRFLLPLLKEGFDIHGFDASESMLAALQRKAKANNLKPNVWKGFIEDFKSEQTYALMFIPAGSFGLMTDPVKIELALQVMYRHLQPNGTLLFEVETAKAIPQPEGNWRGSMWTLNPHQQILASFCSTRTADICSAIGRYELIEDGKLLQTEIEEYKIKLYDEPTALASLLKEIGFNQVRLLKAFDANRTYDKEDEAFVVECIK